MKRLLFLIPLLLSSAAYAGTASQSTVYASNGQVTSTNLNGNFQSILSTLNGGIDNTNIDTADGYRLFEIKSSLPSAGTQGRTIFLTSDNSLNVDTGATFTKSVTITGSTTGDLIYYNGGWSRLAAGTQYYPLVSNGAAALPTYQRLSATGGGTNADLSAAAQGAVPYFSTTGTMAGLAAGTSGQVLMTQGSSANPTWANALSSVSDYGTSASSSTARQATGIKVAYGTLSINGNSTAALSNLPFSSSSSYVLTASFGTATDATEALVVSRGSGSACTIYNNDNQAQTALWIAIGT